MNPLDDLYQEVILHHSKSPRNFGVLENANCEADGRNPLCGDMVHLTLRVEEGKVQEVRFNGAGCAISTASASMMTDAIRGQTVEEVKALFAAFRSVIAEGGEEPEVELGKLEVLFGVRQFPIRVKCAMLAWRTLEAALLQNKLPVTTE